MYGLNAGYDSRSLKSGNTDTGVSVTNKKTVGFQQIALNAEAVSNGWTFNGYGLIPVGDVEQKLNSVYQGGALNTYGLDVGYFITPASASLRWVITTNTVMRNMSMALASSVVSLMPSTTTSPLVPTSPTTRRLIHVSPQTSTWRFNTNGGPGNDTPKTNNAVEALTSTPSNRDVRVHDAIYCYEYNGVHWCNDSNPEGKGEGQW